MWHSLAFEKRCRSAYEGFYWTWVAVEGACSFNFGSVEALREVFPRRHQPTGGV